MIERSSEAVHSSSAASSREHECRHPYPCIGFCRRVTLRAALLDEVHVAPALVFATPGKGPKRDGPSAVVVIGGLADSHAPTGQAAHMDVAAGAPPHLRARQTRTAVFG